MLVEINRERNFLEPDGICLLNPKFIELGKCSLIQGNVKKGKMVNKKPVRVMKNKSFGFLSNKDFIAL